MARPKCCPFCGGKLDIAILDGEFNIHTEEGYEGDPWSGLQYGLMHELRNNPDCPIATEDFELLGRFGYDTKKEAIQAWNRRF